MIRTKHTLLISYILLPLLTIFGIRLSGCDAIEDGPVTNVDVPGQYEAAVFEADIDGNVVDVLAAGGALTITLREDGTVAGRLLIPEALADGEEGDLPFAGTYFVFGNNVRIDHEADTFVRDAVWIYADGGLQASSGGITVHLERE